MILKKAVVMGSLIAGNKGGCPEYHLSEYKDLLGFQLSMDGIQTNLHHFNYTK